MGNKLDTSVAFQRKFDDDEDDVTRKLAKGGKINRARQRNQKRYEIKAGIEGSQLWRE